MKQPTDLPTERLIRVRAVRRGKPVELLIHYEVTRVSGCETYHLRSVEQVG